jgi:hypothetical protein
MSESTTKQTMRFISYMKRLFASFDSMGCDISKMHEYFGYTKSDHYVLRNIRLERDEEYYTKMKVTITAIERVQNDDESDSELLLERNLVYALELPPDYPFRTMIWRLLSNTENGLEKPYIGPDPNEMYCGKDSSPSMTFESDILIYVSTLHWFNK